MHDHSLASVVGAAAGLLPYSWRSRTQETEKELNTVVSSSPLLSGVLSKADDLRWQSIVDWWFFYCFFVRCSSLHCYFSVCCPANALCLRSFLTVICFHASSVYCASDAALDGLLLRLSVVQASGFTPLSGLLGSYFGRSMFLFDFPVRFCVLSSVLYGDPSCVQIFLFCWCAWFFAWLASHGRGYSDLSPTVGFLDSCTVGLFFCSWTPIHFTISLNTFLIHADIYLRQWTI